MIQNQIKKNIFIIILGSNGLLSCNPENWCRNIVQSHIPHEDLTLILNLLYWSYARSNATCQAQKSYLMHIEHCLQAGQNMHQTRRNPSLKRPYHYALNDIEQTHSDFIDSMQHYYHIADTYAEASEYVLNVYPLQVDGKNALHALRSLARTKVMSTTASEVATFVATFNQLKESLHQKRTLGSTTLDSLAEKRSIVNFVAHWIPSAALGGMIAYDQQFTNLTHELWKILINAYESGNTMWDIFETTRAKLYQTYYIALYQQLIKLNAHASCFLQAFDHHGFIAHHNRTETLPTPIELMERP